MRYILDVTATGKLSSGVIFEQPAERSPETKTMSRTMNSTLKHLSQIFRAANVATLILALYGVALVTHTVAGISIV